MTALAVNLANRIIDELHSEPGHFESHSAITSFLSRVQLRYAPRELNPVFIDSVFTPHLVSHLRRDDEGGGG